MTTPTPDLTSRPFSCCQALLLLGGLGVVAAGCSSGGNSSEATATSRAAASASTTLGTTTTTTTTPVVTTCVVIPDETGGPFPGDGSNGPDVLSETGAVRKDITTSFDGMTGTAEGVPYTIQFTVVDVDNGCKPLTGGGLCLGTPTVTVTTPCTPWPSRPTTCVGCRRSTPTAS